MTNKKNNFIIYEVRCGHGSCLASGYAVFDFNKGQVVAYKAPYSTHESVLNEALNYGIEAARKVAKSVSTKYSGAESYICFVEETFSEFAEV